MQSSKQQSNEAKHLRKDLGLADSSLLVIGSMIGSAIFIVTSSMARQIGSPGWMLLLWVISGAITLAAALSFGELAAMMPKAGGQYIYLREAYTPMLGFLYGWTFFTAIQAGSIAAIAVAFAKFASVLVPFFSSDNIWFVWGAFKFTAQQALAIGSILLLTYVNVLGIHEGKIVQNFLTVIKTLSLAGLVILGLFIGLNWQVIQGNWHYFWDLAAFNGQSFEALSGFQVVGAIFAATVGSLFAMDAWNNITFTAGEVVNPKRNIPLSLAIGTATVIILYLLVNVAYLAVLPFRGDPAAADLLGKGIAFASGEQVGVAVAETVLGSTGAWVMALLIMLSAFGCNNGLILAGARVFYAMARDGLFFKSAQKLNKRASPYWSLVWQGGWAALLCLSGTYDELLNFVIFVELIFYLLTVVGLFILRKKQPKTPRPYRVTLYPYLPIFYLITGSCVALSLLVYSPGTSLGGVVIVLIGIPVYYIWKKLTHLES